MAQAQKKQTLLRKQPAMRKVLLALLPCMAGSVYFFGWRSLAMILFCCGWGFFLEWLFCRSRKEPVSEAFFVTAILFALVMPPGVGWHVLAVGMAFAVIFSKEVFGGFGRNIFNPALAGRCFVYVCFPVALTGMWVPPAEGPMGALTKWTSAKQANDTIAKTGATPMAYLKTGQLVFASDSQTQTTTSDIPFVVGKDEAIQISKPTLLKGLLVGRISGTMGVTSAVLILIGGIYLFWTKTASRTTILSLIITYAVINQVLFWLGVKPIPGAWPALLGGGFLFGTFFMATDPVSSPRTEPGKVFYGILIALSTVVIRNFSIFNGGLMFAILLGNMFAPIIDYGVKAWQDRQKAKHNPKEATE
ncbi:MAG: RnfABCDGE type electron transport complex subunit D [Phycisphaerae bacterium]|nr:RnfABCDGE type electron transport complex subunit D [Phycisphaerae bacterium]